MIVEVFEDAIARIVSGRRDLSGGLGAGVGVEGPAAGVAGDVGGGPETPRRSWLVWVRGSGIGVAGGASASGWRGRTVRLVGFDGGTVAGLIVAVAVLVFRGAGECLAWVGVPSASIT